MQRLRRLSLLSWLGPLAAYLLVGALLYREAKLDAWSRVDRASRVAQEHALKVFETNRMLLQRMLDLLGERSDAQLLAEGPVLHEQLRRMTEGLPQVQGVYVNGADARALASDRYRTPPRDIDYSDRAWYHFHREGAAGALYVSQRLISRSTGEPFFDTSLRREAADGRFIGTVHVSLRPGYFTDFYRDLAVSEPAIRLAIVRADLSIIARWPDEPLPADPVAPRPGDPFLQAFAAASGVGHAESASPVDGVRRLRTVRAVSPYPLYTLAAVNHGWVLGQWLRRMAVLGLFVLPLTLAFVLVMRAAMRHAERRVEAAAALEAATRERQQAELALVNAQKLETLGRLTGGVAHDFNNLLAVVSSNLYLLRREHPALAASTQSAAIDRAVATGSRLTRQLLAFSHSQALRPQLVDLHVTLPAVADMLKPLLGRRIEIDHRLAPGPLCVRVDPAELELALVNLAVNARDAMPRGGRLTLAAWIEGHGTEERVVLEVTDTGTGIDPAALPNVFEPFVTTKPAGRGTGLGLSQVRRLCRSAGGDAWVHHTSTAGTALRLALPAVRPPPPALAAERPAVRGLDIVLVEDNEDVAASTAQMLSGMGHRVQRVASAEEAEALLATGPAPQLLITDIELAGERDGLSLATRLRETLPALPVLLVTGFARRLDEATARQWTVLPKPVSAELLAHSVAMAATAPLAVLDTALDAALAAAPVSAPGGGQKAPRAG